MFFGGNMKRVIKLFWSYNIIKTEQWLSDMAKEGYILKEVNTIGIIFTFEKSNSKNLIYRICYEEDGAKDISISLKKEEWGSVCQRGRWIFICNEKSLEDIKLKPIRHKLIKRNRFTNNLIRPIIVLYSILFLPMFIILTTFWLSFGSSDKIIQEGNPLIIYYFNHSFQTMLFIVFVFGVYTRIKLNRVNKDIKLEDNIHIISVEEDNDLEISEDKLIKKKRLNWYYNEEKTIQWLNDMASKGYSLCKVDNSGNKFYFTKGEVKKIKYVIDYQSEVTRDYYEVHKEDGWKLKYRNKDEYNHWNLWSREYEGVEPEIYTDYMDLLDYAKNLFISHTIKFIPLILLWLSLFYTSLNRDEKIYITAFLYLLMAFEYGKFYFNITRHYFKIRKKAKDQII